MKSCKIDLPDMYDEIPFPEGYFDKPVPGSVKAENSGYDVFMALDYSKLVDKQLARLTADEVEMFKTTADGKMVSPRLFARYLEKEYAGSDDEEKRQEIKKCSLKYEKSLLFTNDYVKLCMDKSTQSQAFNSLSFYTLKSSGCCDSE